MSASTEEVAAQSQEVSALVQTATDESASVLAAVSFFKLDSQTVQPERQAAPTERCTVVLAAKRAPVARATVAEPAAVATHSNGNGHH